MPFAARAATFACIVLVAVNAFVPVARVSNVPAASRSALSMAPVDVASVADASALVSQLPTQLVSLEVTTPAFLAVRRSAS